MFLHSLLQTDDPISGWIYGSATFWFPDYPVFWLLYVLTGISGLAFPLYAAFVFVGIGLAMGWALAEAGFREGRGWLAGMLVVNGVLWCQFVAEHGRWLWKAGWPAFHGGTVINGFVILAFVLRALRLGGWTRWRLAGVTAVMVLGLLSNASIIFHWIMPLSVVLVWQALRRTETVNLACRFCAGVMVAFAITVAVRAGLWVGEYFYHAPLVRELPWISVIAAGSKRFWMDFVPRGLFAREWIFWVLGPLAVMSSCWWWLKRRPRAAGVTDAREIASPVGIGGLVLALLLPFSTGYWIDASCDRYMFNWIFVPPWLLVLALAGRVPRSRLLCGGAVVLTVAGLAVSMPKLDREALTFPRPAGAEALLEFCRERGLTVGASDYWAGHYLTAVWRHEGPQLMDIQDASLTFFWCNNVFEYFPHRLVGTGRMPADIQFVVLDRLNGQLLKERLGGELALTTVGGYGVAVLTPTQRLRASELILKEAHAYLGHGRHADWLNRELAKP